MGIEASPNAFRASLRDDRPNSPVVSEKRGRSAGSGKLSSVMVPRSEGRSSNQRGGDRHRLSDEQAIVRRRGKNHVVELINLSQGGAMVAGRFKARLWDMVELVLGAGDNGTAGAIECAVRWIRDGRYGLEFAHETQVQCDSKTLDQLLRDVIQNSFPGVELNLPAPPVEADQAPEPEQKRGDIRHPLIWKGILHHDFEWQAVRLRNISRLGAQIECSTALNPGATVYLDLEAAGRLAATVSWSRGDQSGLSFHEPFDVRSLSKVKPDVAAAPSAKRVSDEKQQSAPSPWSPQWRRVSVKDLARNLGG